jgi:beta-1,4-mannooligosaccharide/beta-1,4-mannosyl-N-acetylglucosamine phosphorylase
LESEDGRNWRARSLGPPDNRNQVVFPERIDGRWVRLERPMHDYGGDAMGAGRYGIWCSFSPDLTHWGDTRFVCDGTGMAEAGVKIGPGAPPIRTAAGWLCIIHTVADVAGPERKRGWEDRWMKQYSAGALLLDLDDPSRLVAIAPGPLLSPFESFPYERIGFRNDVIFPSGVTVESTPGGGPTELRVYYGAADACVAMASAPLDDVVDFVLRGAQPSD